jgi:hypothetical protein
MTTNDGAQSDRSHGANGAVPPALDGNRSGKAA